MKLIPEIVFGVSQRRSTDIQKRLQTKGIKTLSVTRRDGLTYLEFKTEAQQERAVKWIYTWYEHEFPERHWSMEEYRTPLPKPKPEPEPKQNHSAILKTLISNTIEGVLTAILKAHGVKIAQVIPTDDIADGQITLGGMYEGLYIQMGDGYYYIGKTLNGQSQSWPGKGKLMSEIIMVFNTKKR